jgi:hypothetical protein
MGWFRATSATAAETSSTSLDVASPPLEVVEGGGLEISHLWRYLAVALLVALCALISAWSRIDLVETSVALDAAENRLSSAQAERARLELELATLSDPAHLSDTARALQLTSAVPVVDVPPAPAAAVAAEAP